MVENGHNVAVIENHNNDSLANVYSNARNNYYSFPGYPTYFFDGGLEIVGGIDNWYTVAASKVNQRNNIMSDFTIDIQHEQTDGDYNATITVDNVGGNTTTGLVLQVVITESYLPITWGFSDEQNYVNRLMVPNQNGTILDFSGGNTQIVELSFSTTYWVIDNCEIVAFVQNNSSKEILQGTKKFLAIPEYDVDAQLQAIESPEDIYEFCGGVVMPKILIQNKGAENLVSLDIEYSINGGDPQTYQWTGDIPFNIREHVSLPEIPIVPEDDNIIEITLSNPNGEVDPNPDNDYLSKEFDYIDAPQVETTVVNFEIRTDQYPGETTWELTNSVGVVVYEGGPYSGPNTVYTEIWEVENMDCYTFTIHDSYGDGICCAFGQGYYKLMDYNNIAFAEGGEFGTEESKVFEALVIEVLTADFEADVTSILEGESVNFTDLSIGNVTSWEWTFEGGDPATSSEQNPTIEYMTQGEYDVTLTVSDGTNSNTVIKENYIVVDFGTGIHQLARNESFVVYPNPFKNNTNITFNISEGKNVTVMAYNLIGDIVYESQKGFLNAGEHTFVIQSNNLEKGIYFFRLIAGENIYSQKVTVIK